jgi:lysine N-acyltransferase
MTSSSRRVAVSLGSSGRRLGRPLAPDVEALGPPPTPVLVPPWGLAAVEVDGAGLDLIHRWMCEPHVAEFWRQDWPLSSWAAEVARQMAGDHSRPWTVSYEGSPVAYVEVYRASRDVLADHHPTATRDLGVHIAIGERRRTGRGFGPRVLRAVSDGLFRADPRCGAVLGDPEATHDVARRAFAAAGFVPVAEVDLPHKRAAILARHRPATGGLGS